jgi:CMP-N-acetylneuraminic acid synthetase
LGNRLSLRIKYKKNILVTSDDDEILRIDQKYEADDVIVHRRPDELANDKASTVTVLINALEKGFSLGYKPTKIILL